MSLLDGLGLGASSGNDPSGGMGSLAVGAASGAMAGSVVPGLGTAIGAGVGLLGAGLQMYGANQTYQAEQQKTSIQQDMTKTEMQQDAVRRQAMEISARRQQMEVLRNAQRGRSLALNNAVSSGANFGSGLQGGYGQVAGQSNTNMLGINQNLQAGENMFDLNNQLSQQRIQYAAAGGQSNTGQGISSLGGSLISSMGNVRNLTMGVGASNNQGSIGVSGTKGGNGGWGYM